MAAITFSSKLTEEGSFIIPHEAVEQLGLQPGDTLRVRIETDESASLSLFPDQAELRRRGEHLFEEADNIVREPGKPLTDPLEATWAAGVEEKARKMGLKV